MTFTLCTLAIVAIGLTCGVFFLALIVAGFCGDAREGIYPAETPEDEENTFFRNLGR